MTGVAHRANRSAIVKKIDSAIRFFLYALIFWIPYSNAVIEICVISALILWIIKRCLFIDWSYSDRQVINTLKYFVKSFKPQDNFLNKPIAFFLIICALSTLNSTELFVSLRAFLTKTVEWFVVYYLVCEAFTDKSHIKKAIIVLFITAGATFLDGIVQFHITKVDIFNGLELARGGATAGFKHANGLGGYMTITLPLLLSLCLTKHKSKVRFFVFAFLLLLAGWTLLVTFSRAAWMATFLGCVFLFYFLNRKVTKWLLIGFTLLIVGGYVLIPHNIKSKARLDSDHIIETFKWRTNIWNESFNMIRQRPLLGHGINTFMQTFKHYRSKNIGRYDYSPTYLHNCYLQMMAEVGLLGLSMFMWIMVRLFKRLYGIFSKIKARQNELTMIVLGLYSGIVAYLIHSGFDVNFYSLQLSIHFWAMIGLLVSIYRLLNNSKNYGIKTT